MEVKVAKTLKNHPIEIEFSSNFGKGIATCEGDNFGYCVVRNT